MKIIKSINKQVLNLIDQILGCDVVIGKFTKELFFNRIREGYTRKLT